MQRQLQLLVMSLVTLLFPTFCYNKRVKQKGEMKLTNNFWNSEDFDLFLVEGLQNRMNKLQTNVQPKFEILGKQFAGQLSAHGSDEFFFHIAKHARRTVNPPTDSWVAFAPSKRGYKALPHFQIGLWNTHLFIITAIIYENPNKKIIAERLKQNLNDLTTLPKSYVVSGDHMKPEAFKIADIGEGGLLKILNRLQDVKKAEFLVGRHLSKEDAIKMADHEFLSFVDETFEQLLSIYNVIIGKK